MSNAQAINEKAYGLNPPQNEVSLLASPESATAVAAEPAGISTGVAIGATAAVVTLAFAAIGMVRKCKSSEQKVSASEPLM